MMEKALGLKTSKEFEKYNQQKDEIKEKLSSNMKKIFLEKKK